jgi:hypothetical protein
VKQAYATLDAMEGVTEADWETKSAEIAAEFTLERAQQDLSDGWKAWLKENGPGKGCGTKEVIRPASGSPQECVTELPGGDARMVIESCGYARMAIEIRCVCQL